MRKRLLPAVAVALLLLPGAVAAQIQGTIQATAVVLSPLTVTGGPDLVFNNVIPGVNQTVLPADGTAGRFDITGSGVLEVQLDFTLPGSLTGPASLPITFAGQYAGYSPNSATPPATTFNPTSGGYLTNLVAGGLSVYLGGQVQPAATQAAGNYSGTVTLTVAYTGS